MRVRKLVLWLLLICIVSLGSAACLAWQEGAFNPTYWRDRFEEDDMLTVDVERDFSVTDIEAISIKTVSADVAIVSTSSDTIEVRLHGKSSRNVSLATEIRGNTLEVDIERNPSVHIGINFEYMQLEVLIPESFTQDLMVCTSSGDIEIDAFTLNEVWLHVMSGDADVSGLTVNQLDWEAASGYLMLSDFAGNLNAEVLSGDVEVQFAEPYTWDIDVSTASGDVDLLIPAQSDFSIDARTASGKVRSEHAVAIFEANDRNHLVGQVGQESDNEVRVNVTSGNITIRK